MMGVATFVLPDFVIVGANKAGTSSIASYLGSHPAIQMSRVKEPMFFTSRPYHQSPARTEARVGRPYFATTLPEYSALFDGAKPTVGAYGEASTAYLADSGRASELMKKLVPDVKIIAVLREPTERAVSAYKMCYGNGIESKPFHEIVAHASSQTKIRAAHNVKEYVRNGLYAQLLEPFFALFDASQLQILDYGDLDADANAFLQRILDFLDLAPHDFDVRKRHNTASAHVGESLGIEPEDMRALRKVFYPEMLALQAKGYMDVSRWLALAEADS
jgi:hypothetical protein